MEDVISIDAPKEILLPYQKQVEALNKAYTTMIAQLVTLCCDRVLKYHNEGKGVFPTFFIPIDNKTRLMCSGVNVCFSIDCVPYNYNKFQHSYLWRFSVHASSHAVYETTKDYRSEYRELAGFLQTIKETIYKHPIMDICKKR